MKVSSRQLWQLNVCSAVGLSDCRYGFYFTCLRQLVCDILYFRCLPGCLLSFQLTNMSPTVSLACFSFPRSFPLAHGSGFSLHGGVSPMHARLSTYTTVLLLSQSRVNSVKSIFKSNQFSPLKLTIHIGLHLNSSLRACFTSSFGYRLASSFLFSIEYLSLGSSLLFRRQVAAVLTLLSGSYSPSSIQYVRYRILQTQSACFN